MVYVIGNSEWPESRKIYYERSEVFIFHNSGHEEFIKLILLLFGFAQRLSLSSDTQKREGVVTRLTKEDLHPWVRVDQAEGLWHRKHLTFW